MANGNRQISKGRKTICHLLFAICLVPFFSVSSVSMIRNPKRGSADCVLFEVLAAENIAAVNVQNLPGNVRCHCGGEKQDGHGDFFRLREAPERYSGVDPSRL